MALLTKVGGKDYGFGQVEPNHLSAQRNGQIYAQLPVKAGINTLQNGQFVKYDYTAGNVNFTGEGEFLMVFNEVKLYDPKHSYKDFVYKREDFTDKQMFPRVIKTMPGDIYTTNLVEMGTITVASELAGKKLVPDALTGYLKVKDAPEAGDMVWSVAKVYTMADGSPAVKLQRIA